MGFGKACAYCTCIFTVIWLICVIVLAVKEEYAGMGACIGMMALFCIITGFLCMKFGDDDYSSSSTIPILQQPEHRLEYRITGYSNHASLCVDGTPV
jgi:hypothetical protein